MTVETIPMDRAEAQRITERIRIALDRVSTAWADLAERIAEAYQRRADLALGYGSWAEYAEAELKPTEGLAADVRRQLVGMLSAQGMSTRAIAPAVGKDYTTVSRDRQVLHDATPDPLAEEKAEGRVVKLTGPGSLLHSEDGERIDHATGEVLTGPVVAPLAPSGKVMGLDGKTYTRPTPQPAAAPKRRPITDQFFDAAYDVNRRIESLHRLTRDDRFPQNAQKVAQKHLHDLLASRDLLQQVIDHLS